MSAANQFIPLADVGMADPALQQNLNVFRRFAPKGRDKAIERLGDFDTLRSWTKDRKDFTLDHLAHYLEQLETNVQANDGQVHWAGNGDDLNQIVQQICQTAGARHIVKAKTMVSEETGLTHHLNAAGFDTLETDLGEYIIQLAQEPPSHIIGPAIHKSFEQIVELFKHHHDLGERQLDDAKAVMAEAREQLRNAFLNADVGITGANYLVADSGTVGLVTNEGNGDLCATLPRVHIVVTSIDKVVPDMATAMAVQRLLVPSATAQAITCYTSFFTGNRRHNDPDGPAEFHLVLLDNGRSDILQSDYREILRCIRCSACLNHCPIYTRTGGHAYGWVYPGPMGSVWTPLLNGLADGHQLANACTACGRCEEVCPVDIPLPALLRDLRRDEQAAGLQPERWVIGMKLYTWLLGKPKLFQWCMNMASRVLHRLGRKRGRFTTFLLANGWTQVRDLPAPQGASFFSQLKQQRQLKQQSHHGGGNNER